MRYPHNNFPQDWSLTAGYEFNDITSYGRHDGQDVNDKKGGDSDLGQPIFAEADGVIDLIHNHTSKPTFGNHYFLRIEGPWGTRWMHHGHCLEIYSKQGDKVKEGQLIAKIGKSGTDYSHDHWSCCKQITGDNVANSVAELNQYWEDPIKFVEKWKDVILDDMPPYLKGLFNENGLDINNESQIRAFFQQAKEFPQIKKDLENCQIANKQQAVIISEYENKVEKLNKDLDKVIKDFKTYKEQVENAPLPPIPSPVVDPLPSSSLADLVRSMLKKLGF